MRIEFFAPLEKIPTVTAQEKGIDFKRRRVYTKPEVEAVKNQYIAILMQNRPPRTLEGAIGIKVTFRFPFDTKHKKEGEWKTSKPDTDNMLKLWKDCATACGYWNDDSQVAVELIAKKYSKNSGIFFYAEELEENEEPPVI